MREPEFLVPSEYLCRECGFPVDSPNHELGCCASRRGAGIETPSALRADASPGDGLCHIVPDTDPDTALCGTDVSGDLWCDCPEGRCVRRPSCVVCTELDREA